MKKALFSFLGFFAFASFMASATKHYINPTLTVLALVLLALFASPSAAKGYTAMGVEREVWVDYIIKRFWKDNSWMKNFYSDDQYVVGGKTVHIPQPGSKPTITKNPTSFPLTAARRTDTVLSYDLDWYVTAPTHITDAEKQEISYDKIDSVLGEHLGVITERIAEEHLINSLNGVAGSTNVIYTSGASAVAKISGQTGNRKVMVVADFKKCVTKLNLLNVPKTDRFSILDSNSLDELTDSMSDKQWNAFNQYFNEQTGVIGKLFGVTIFERSDVAIAAAALSSGNLAVNAYGAATGATDLAVNMIWHKDAITRAMGEVKFFEDIDNPLYAGDIYNAGIRFGGRKRRAANIGVIALAQGTP